MTADFSTGKFSLFAREANEKRNYFIKEHSNENRFYETAIGSR
jgi:hypothetical protein